MPVRDNPSSIRDCNVCVIGGAGFLGSHTVEHLVMDRGCRVLVIDNLISGRREFVHPAATFEWADITDSESHLRRLFAKYQTQFVLNFAAEPYIPVSFERPLHVFNVNAFGAMKVINAAWESGVEAILQVSSAELYGGPDGLDPRALPVGITEDYPVVPHSSYGAAKAAIDAMVQVRWREARAPVIALRQFNCVGERDTTHPYVVPEIISQFARTPRVKHARAVVRLGNNSFRDFLYAGDQARMAVELLERGQFGEVYNLGSQEGIRIYELADLLAQIMGFAGADVATDTARVRPWEIWRLLACNAKLYDVIDGRPTVHLREALERTVQWFYENGQRWAWEPNPTKP